VMMGDADLRYFLFVLRTHLRVARDTSRALEGARTAAGFGRWDQIGKPGDFIMPAVRTESRTGSAPGN
jgi:hypothetical protein